MKTIEKLILKPYTITTPDVEPVPDRVAEFLRDEFGTVIRRGESANVGDFKYEIIEDSNNTGHGMDYLNELRITKGDEIIYSSGMLKWRNGLPGGRDYPSHRFLTVAIKDVEENITLAIEYGDDQIKIFELGTCRLYIAEDYDVAANKKAVASHDLSTLDGFKEHYCDNSPHEYHKWKGGCVDREFELGKGRTLFLNGHPTDIVYGQVHILVISDGKPYYAVIELDHQWRRKFQDSNVTSVNIDRNVLKLVTCSGGSITTEVELVIDEG